MTCINGRVEFVTVCTGIAHAEFIQRKNDFYDRDWNFLPFYTTYYLNSGKQYDRPDCLDDLIRFSEILTKDVPTARVDFYMHEGTLYFGEVTFFTWGGFFNFNDPKWDLYWGEKLALPEHKII